MSKAKQTNLGLTDTTPVNNVEEFKFEPIKGYPMLNWRGKRPFTSTRYYPVQLKEVHGEEVEGWRNKIYWGDNLQVMSHLLKEYRGKINLIYIDPPFDSKADYKKRIKIKGQTLLSDKTAFEEKQYTDIWANDEYLQFIYERLILLRELLKESGAIFLHCDTKKSHVLRSLLDEIFGSENFKNEIVRIKCNPKNSNIKAFGNIHDTILFYTKGNGEQTTWNAQREEIDSADLERIFEKVHVNGRRYTTVALHAPGERFGETGQPWKGVLPPAGRHWAYVHAQLDEFDKEGRVEWSSTGVPRLIRWADENEGYLVQDVWTMKDPQYSIYPTEKPSELVERIISAVTQPNDIVFDCFMGSGTTQIAALKLKRRFIGADINLGAIQTTSKQLLNYLNELPVGEKQAELFSKLSEDESQICPVGFEVYNVNHYDVFRNPLEARALLLDAMEVNKIEKDQLYDGEKDGRMIKILPVNRIATRADLGELIAGLDLKAFEKRHKKNPNEPVERITLVCMGHEPDLKASLMKEVEPYKLDVEVVDILRDRQDLQFKRDSEAKVVIKNGKLVIERFYPMNLLGKLSLQKEKVKDWRELVESVMIDWNYDGAVLSPTTVDIPEKDEFVSGTYPIPKESGTIRIKITDLLSESLEVEVENG